jgi:hypothetical protein
MEATATGGHAMAQDGANAPNPRKAHKGVGMEGFIATWYARPTARAVDEFRSVSSSG